MIHSCIWLDTSEDTLAQQLEREEEEDLIPQKTLWHNSWREKRKRRINTECIVWCHKGRRNRVRWDMKWEKMAMFRACEKKMAMFRAYEKWREGEIRLERWFLQSRITKEESHEKSRLEWWWKMEVLAGIEVVISSLICCRFFYFMMNENFLSAYFTSSFSPHLLLLAPSSFFIPISSFLLLFNSVSRSITSCQIIHEWQIILQNVTFSQPWLAHTFPILSLPPSMITSLLSSQSNSSI